jgi:hypothetical protein
MFVSNQGGKEMTQAEKDKISDQVKSTIDLLNEFWQNIIELGKVTNCKIDCTPLNEAIIRLQLIKDLENNYIIK